MPVPSQITDLSTTPASNSPSGSEAPTEGDNHLRTAYAFIKQLYDGVSGVAYPTLAQLASTASASNGAGLIGISPMNYVAGTVGAWLMDGYVNVMWFMTAAERQDVRSGTGSIDVQPKLTAASTWAETLKKGVFLPSGVYKQGSTWAVPLSVGLLGETSGAPQAIFDPGTAWQYGPVIYKAHSGDSITKIAPSGAYNEAASIRNITFSSNRTTWPAGDCIVLDRVSHCHIYDCNAWSVGNDFIVIGRTAGDVTGHCYVFNCYSNAPVGAHYRIRAKWVRLENVVGDGGAYGIYLDNAPELRVQGWHFEGFSTSAVKVTNGSQYLTFTGKGVIGVTISNTATGFEIDNTAGNSSITIENVNMGGPSTTTAITFTGALVAATAGTLTSNWAGLTRSYTIVFSDGSVRTGVTLTNGSAAVSWTGAVTATANATAVLGSLSRAVWIKGNQATSVTTRNCQIRNWDIGVDDDGSDFTRVLDNQFDACRLPIRANSQRTQYKGNTATSTIGNCAIDHVGYVGASGGVWEDNILDKQILATLSGVKGNYGNNLVKNNRGFRTAYQGTSAAAASPIVMAHGLGAAPADADATILSGTYANLTVAFDATNVTVSWTGGANCQVQVRAQLSCELQYA